MIIRNFYHQNFHIHHYQELSSTNSLALELAKNYQIDHNHIILADSQTGGKGRMGRNWVSPIGNLYFSLILKPQKPVNISAQLSFLGAVAMGLAIAEFGDDQKINYKWPNDILISGQKVAGILLESDFCGQQNQDFSNGLVILGIGVNINSYPQETIFPACSLIDQGFSDLDKILLLKEFLNHFTNLYQKWLDFGFTPIRNLWLRKAFNLNQEISVNLSNKSQKGIFKDLDQEGNLLLESAGKLHKINCGEILL